MPTAAEAAQQKAVDEALAKQREQFAAEQKQAVDAAVADAVEKQRTAYESQTPAPAGDATEAEPTVDHVLVSDTMETAPTATSPARSYSRGDKVPLTAVRAAELIAAGAVEDPDAPKPAKRGGETQAPE